MQRLMRNLFHAFRSFGIVYLCVLYALCGSRAFADEFSQVSRQSVRLFSTGTLVVETRVGDLRIEGWEEPRVEIEAEKVVRARSEAKARRHYDRIKIELAGSDKEVRLRTVYPPRRLWRPLRGASKLSVNYRIRMPFDANLALKCANGAVRIHGLFGHQQIRVNFGDVEINLPSLHRLRSLDARAWLGYVQSDLHGEDAAGFARKLSFWNSRGKQDINVRVRLGGVYVYSHGD